MVKAGVGTLARGCDAPKAIAEQALKEKLILGRSKFAELDHADVQVRRTLSLYDWKKHWFMYTYFNWIYPCLAFR